VNEELPSLKDGTLVKRFLRNKLNVSSLAEWKKALPQISCSLIGIGFVCLVCAIGYENALQGEGRVFIAGLLITGPIAFVLSYIHRIAAEEGVLPFGGHYLYWILAGAELALVVVAFMLLLDWYDHPDNLHLNPLFVVATVALVVLEYTRRTWRAMDEDKD